MTYEVEGFGLGRYMATNPKPQPQPIPEPIKQWVAPIEYFEVGISSFELMTKPKSGRKSGTRVVYPFLSLQIGQSFKVPLDYSEVTLRVNMNNAEKRNTGLKFRLFKHATHYEIGRIN